MSINNETYSILGAARSGLAAARLLRREGAAVFVSDMKEATEDALRILQEIGADYEFGGHTDRVLQADTLILSPGVPDTAPIVRQAIEKGMRITNEIEIAAARCRAEIVAITGTNGKTTTTELTGFILRHAGRNAHVAGNIGIPFSEVVLTAGSNDVVVLEVSSFQLEHISSFRPRVAILLNMTPDHLDRYAGFEEYTRAKSRITMNQQADDLLIYNADDEHTSATASRSGARTLGFSITEEVAHGASVREDMLLLRGATDSIVEEEIMRIDEIRIRGPHNLYNAMAAALAVRSLGVETTTIAEALSRFAGVPHRLEPVRELDGVSYVNDSKATNVDSLWYALSSFKQPIVLIAGGRSKKNRYEAILPLLRSNVKSVVLIGEASMEMERAFAGAASTTRAEEGMEQAVALAREIASPGDVVLLSPACASFDMFNNYEHRGDTFKSIVRALEPQHRGQEVAQ